MVMIKCSATIEAITNAAICPLMPRRLRKPSGLMPAASRRGAGSERLHRRRKHVAAGAHRLDHGGFLRIALDLAPDTADQDVDAAFERTGIAALGEVEQALARQHAAGPLAEGPQQVELG